MALTDSRNALNNAMLEKGLTWSSLQPLVAQWWADFKEWEAADTFGAAFQDSRMTARQVNTGSSARGGTFLVPNVGGIGGNREMTLVSNVAGIRARLNPLNFFDKEGLKRQKNSLGLHDVSASLLNPKRPISTQLKGYDDSIALFMPMPLEEDLKLFYTLNEMGKNELKGQDDNQIRILRSQMTRIKLAQASDMGTTFVDVSKPGATQGSLRYGMVGTIIRTKGGIGMPATETELKARKTNALKYKSILGAMKTTVNEVIVAYRSHASANFPMFALEQEVVPPPRVIPPTPPGGLPGGAPPPPPPMVQKQCRYVVMNVESGLPTGWIITDGGLYQMG